MNVCRSLLLLVEVVGEGGNSIPGVERDAVESLAVLVNDRVRRLVSQWSGGCVLCRLC